MNNPLDNLLGLRSFQMSVSMSGVVMYTSLLIAVLCIQYSGGQSLVTSDGCGKTKGCFRDPDNCEASSSKLTCNILISWKPVLNTTSTEFEILGRLLNGEDYTAMGFSLDKHMPNTDVWACLQLGDSNVTLDHSFNTDHENKQGNKTGSSNFEYTNTEGVIQCKFTRLNKIEGSVSRFFDLSANVYHLLVARGPRLDIQPPKLNKHHRSPLLSKDAFNFTVVSTGGKESNFKIKQKVHGSLMVFGWIGFASIAIVMARYFKPMWPNSSLLGQKVWFTCHRVLMVFTLLCVCIAFIIIFVDLGGWVPYTSTSDLRFVHAIMGCIIVALGITNPIMAICRPKPESPNRSIFNWAHWTVGTTAHLLAVANVFIGTKILTTEIPNYVRWILLAWLGFHFLFEIFMEVPNCVYQESESLTSYKIYCWLTKKERYEYMTGPGINRMDEVTSPQSTNVKSAALCVYVITTLGIMGYLIYEVCRQ
ncbi:ferric-chelate reductase 1-like [Glandiceps talaboti]